MILSVHCIFIFLQYMVAVFCNVFLSSFQPHPSLDELHRRRKEIMAQLEERKVISPPPFAPSPTLPHPFHSEEVSIV